MRLGFLLVMVGCTAPDRDPRDRGAEPGGFVPRAPSAGDPIEPTEPGQFGEGGTAPGYDATALGILLGAAFSDPDPLAATVSITPPPDQSFCGYFWDAVGDHDGDGLLDLGLSCIDTPTGHARLHLYSGASVATQTAAPFATVTSTVTGFWNRHPTGLADLDGDGFDELGLRLDEAGRSPTNGVVHLGSTLAGSVALDAGSWTIDAGGYPSDDGLLCAGDVDGDGLDDLLVPQRVALDHETYVVAAADLAAAQSGRYEPAPASLARLVQPQGEIWFVERLQRVGDIDGDGLDDLAATPSASAVVPVFVGADLHGDLDLSAAHATVEAADPTASVSAVYPYGDVDADGLEDVVIGIAGSGGIELALVPGAVLAAGGPVALAAQPSYLVVDGSLAEGDACDVDGDGLRELFVASSFGWDITVYRGSELALGAPTPWLEIDPPGGVRCVGDLDGDGLEDLALSAYTR